MAHMPPAAVLRRSGCGAVAVVPRWRLREQRRWTGARPSAGEGKQDVRREQRTPTGIADRLAAVLPTDFVAKCTARGTKVDPVRPPCRWTLITSFVLLTSSVYILHLVSGTLGVAVLGSMGASACLIFSVPTSRVAQPRVVVLGHTLSAMIGITYSIFSLDYLAAWSPAWAAHLKQHEGGCDPLFGSLAVASATVIMQRLCILHPPAAGTALIMAMSPEAYASGYAAAAPIAVTASIVSMTGLLTNLVKTRRFPLFW